MHRRRRSINVLLRRVTFIDFEIREDAQIFDFGLLLELYVDEMWLWPVRLPVRIEIVIQKLVDAVTCRRQTCRSFESEQQVISYRVYTMTRASRLVW